MPDNTANQDISTQSNLALSVQQWVRIIFFACIITVGSVAAAKFIDVFFPRKISGPFYFWLYPLFVFSLFYAAVKDQWNKAIICFGGILALFAVTCSGIYFEMTLPFEKAKLQILSQKYNNCKRAAIPFANGRGAFQLCEENDRSVYSDGIAYDSSDELPHYSRHSHEWLDVVKQYGSFKNTPFRATPIGQHFYYVAFDIKGFVPHLN